MGRGHLLTPPCHLQTLAGHRSTAGCSSVTSAAACTAAWAATSPSSSTCATAPGPPPCSRWVLGTLERGEMHTGTPRAHWALPVPCRWCTPWRAMGPTPSGSTRCWIRHRCRAGAGRQTPRTKCSKCPLCCGGEGQRWLGAPSSPQNPLPTHSPTKSEFIRAKYQMLAFVHKLPCRDDDGVTAKDLSKVGWGLRDPPLAVGTDPPVTSSLLRSNCTRACGRATWRPACACSRWAPRPTSSTR